MKGSGMPQIRGALGAWSRRISMIKVTQTVNNGLVENVESAFFLRGTIQPFSPKQLMLKPEGERAWEWIMIHCQASDNSKLEPNQIIKYQDRRYKIMAQNDYSLNGYIEYHAIRDYQT